MQMEGGRGEGTFQEVFKSPLGRHFPPPETVFLGCRSGSNWVRGGGISGNFQVPPRAFRRRHFAAGVSPPGNFAARPFRRRNTPTTLKANAPNSDQKGDLLIYVSKGGPLGMVRLGSSFNCTY